MKTPQISIIIPIYNVEQYLEKCLNSIKNQTFKDIEVIMVNDGSTDNSGIIAKKYTTDSRFIYIQTENGGLSAARNRGIDVAKGEWLMFVDSDDWVYEQFCEIPLEIAQKNKADLVIFGYNGGKKNENEKAKNVPAGVIDEFTVYEYIKDYAWNKLYKASLFDGIRYPVGRVYEDLVTTHKLIHKAKQIYLIHNELYFYYTRNNSINNSVSIKNKRDGFISNYERAHDLCLYGYPKEKVNGTVCAAAITYLSVDSSDKDEIYKKAVKIINEQKSIPKQLTNKQKIAFIAWKINKKLFYLLCKYTGKK